MRKKKASFHCKQTPCETPERCKSHFQLNRRRLQVNNYFAVCAAHAYMHTSVFCFCHERRGDMEALTHSQSLPLPTTYLLAYFSPFSTPVHSAAPANPCIHPWTSPDFAHLAFPLRDFTAAWQQPSLRSLARSLSWLLKG